MNKVILIGRLAKDPEMKYLAQTGNAVSKFSLAVDRAYMKDGQKQTDFFNIVVWGKQAENVANYLTKGSLIALDGEIQNRSYENNNGEKRYITEIVASRVKFLSKANGGSDNGTVQDDGYRVLDNMDDVPF